MLTARVIREARILAGFSRADLAAECRIVGTPPISEDYASAIRRALETPE